MVVLGALVVGSRLGEAATALFCVSGNPRRSLGAWDGFRSTFSVWLAGSVSAIVLMGWIQVFLIPLLFTAADQSGCPAGAVRRRASAVPCFCLGKQLRECVWDFLFVALFIFGWIQTAGAASGRLKGRMTEQRVVSGSRKGNCCGVLRAERHLEIGMLDFLQAVCVCS
jgi:hypothetical protein